MEKHGDVDSAANFDATPADGPATTEALVWGVARRVTNVLSFGRSTLISTASEIGTQAGRLLGTLRDTGEDVIAYVNPSAWLEELYSLLGIASSDSIVEMDERMDGVELKLDDVARQRAREELLLLQQRIGELEALLSGLNQGEARSAMETVLGRLAELEARIDSLPVAHGDDGVRIAN